MSIYDKKVSELTPLGEAPADDDIIPILDSSTSTLKRVTKSNLLSGIAGSGTVTTSGTPVDDDFAKFTSATAIEGRSYSETLGDLSGKSAADFSMNTHKITNVVDPAANQDAATKKYVDDNIGSGTVDTSGTPVANDIARFTAEKVIEGRSYAEVRTDLNVENAADVTDEVNIASSIVGVDAKTTPVNADSIAIIDSENTNVLKKSTFTNIKSFLKIYFDTLYAAVMGADDNYVTDVEKAALHTQGTDTALGAVGTKNPPINADKALYRDSTNSDVLVTSTWTQVKAFLKTYFDTLYNKYVLENHASNHTDGTDDIQSATGSQKGLATATQITKLDGIAESANNYTHPNHSGDVTSAADGAQTIGADKVLDSHINWGTGADEVSAVDMPIADSGNYYTGTEGETALQEVGDKFDAMNEPTGFPNRTDSAITWSDSTPDYTLSIAPVGDSFSFYQDGLKYTKSSTETYQISGVEGIHYIYYDAGSLTSTANPTFAQKFVIITSKVLVSIVYWDATNNEGIYIGEERHGITMDGDTHANLHFSVGLRWYIGIALNTIDADQSGANNAHAQFGVDTGSIADEDIGITPDAITSTTGLPVYWRSGADGDWRKDTNAGYSFLISGTRPNWNEFAGGTTWQQTETGDADFMLVHIFATTEKDNPMIAIMGQAVYEKKKDAREGATTEVGNLLLGNLPGPEIAPMESVIFECKDSYTNDVNARIVTTDEGDDYVDWRESDITRTAAGGDHGSLGGLSDDDHPQYIKDSEYTAADEVMVGTGVGTYNQITLAASQFLGKKAAGAVVNLTAAEALTILGVASGADATGSNAPQAHKTSHENAGTDEISVTGLSGVLADDQHVIDAEVQAVSINNVSEDTTPDLGGTLGVGELGIKLDPVIGTNLGYSGIVEDGTAGYGDTAVGELVYLASADGKWEKADADAEATTKPELAMVLSVVAADATVLLLKYGYIRVDTFSITNDGAPLFAGCTEGAIVELAPSGTGDCVRRIGSVYDASAHTIFFNPDGIWLEIT